MIPLSSSNISGYDYNPGTRFLVIYFHGHRAYTYKDVPENIADGLASASSVGKYFNENIKNAFPFEHGIQQTTASEQHA